MSSRVKSSQVAFNCLMTVALAYNEKYNKYNAIKTMKNNAMQ